MPGSVFGPELFAFLRALKRNNDRAWFAKNKARYEQDVKEPVLEFIRAVKGPLHTAAPYLLADPRPVGGSMFRIYRDTRFSKDKTPYKTHASAHFRHAAGRDVHAPGVYLHLEPGSVFMGAGLWRPETDLARKIRGAIAFNGPAFTRAISGKAFKTRFTITGESLARPPKGFSPEHPLIEHLKRKDFIVEAKFTEAQAVAPDFIARFASTTALAAPFLEFLTRACALPGETRSRT